MWTDKQNLADSILRHKYKQQKERGLIASAKEYYFLLEKHSNITKLFTSRGTELHLNSTSQAEETAH